MMAVLLLCNEESFFFLPFQSKGLVNVYIYSEVCSTEQVLASPHQNSQYLQHKFWRALMGTCSAEHASAQSADDLFFCFHSHFVVLILPGM